MNSTIVVTRLVYPHMITKCTLLETYKYNKVQLQFQVTKLITSKTCRTNKSGLKQKKNPIRKKRSYLMVASLAKC